MNETHPPCPGLSPWRELLSADGLTTYQRVCACALCGLAPPLPFLPTYRIFHLSLFT